MRGQQRSTEVRRCRRDCFAARSKSLGLDFSGEHGTAQRAAIERLGHGGRFGLVIAAAGAGKTTALKPLVAAWHAQGRTVYGASLAWRQADDLTSAGIDQRNVKALSVLVDAVRDGSVKLDRKSVVTVDEWGLVGTWAALHLLRLQQRHGFTIVALGDDKQCASVEAGAIIELSRRALGADQVPEILTTRRQQSEREQTIAGLFREGRAAEALAMKRADGTAEMAYGGYDGVVARVASLYRERLEATGAAPTISAPTNSDAHRIGAAVREQRRAMGLLGEDIRSVKATDGERDFTLRLARGDRVRLFRSTGATYANGQGRADRPQRLGARGAGCRRSRPHIAIEAGTGWHRMVGRHADQTWPCSPRLRLRDDHPHRAGLDDARAHQRAASRQSGDRRPTRLLRTHEA